MNIRINCRNHYLGMDGQEESKEFDSSSTIDDVFDWFKTFSDVEPIALLNRCEFSRRKENTPF